MTPLEIAIVVVAGFLAGGINTVVGSGTLVTFPVLLGLGYPPVVANVSNGLGLVPGSVTGAIGYRRELKGQGGRLVRFGIVTVLGAVVGALLLLTLPAGAFEAVVPVLIVVAIALVLLQPLISRKLAERTPDRHPHGGIPLLLGVFATAVYGGYFGAAQGVILIALMGILMEETLQRLNAVKNVFVATANLVSGVVFVFAADVDWLVVALLAGGSVLGGVVGARIGRRLRPIWLRAAIVVVGLAAIVKLIVT
ncbi:sulfite exporter TauE/SafE family protein [Actinophytocola sp.]|uniref:sulfite exporter TauE/SafE family protein n=1 Tax=Actinophytocola sp. TaxID=1872138 RepID=UPI002D467799|nr:sulfite exporter TauE/SafE family protein [Actinophytocola sp.]HYQ67152.1 sulfite exporter TauE/SafE family protein [Actinophytocola sp.]